MLLAECVHPCQWRDQWSARTSDATEQPGVRIHIVLRYISACVCQCPLPGICACKQRIVQGIVCITAQQHAWKMVPVNSLTTNSAGCHTAQQVRRRQARLAHVHAQQCWRLCGSGHSWLISHFAKGLPHTKHTYPPAALPPPLHACTHTHTHTHAHTHLVPEAFDAGLHCTPLRGAPSRRQPARIG